MTERQPSSPERPTPEMIFKSMQIERFGMTVSEYVSWLHSKYDSTRPVVQARIIRDSYKMIDLNSGSIKDDRAARAAFFDGFVVGYHVARQAMPDELHKRAAIGDTFSGLIAGIIQTELPPDADYQAKSEKIIETLMLFVKATYDRSPEYFARFEEYEVEIIKNPAHVEFAQVGYGIAVGVGMIVRDASVESDDET